MIFEFIFALSKEPEIAAEEILEIRDNIDVSGQSRLVSEEICDRCNRTQSQVREKYM